MNDPKRVSTNPFFPFLSYEKHYQPFRTPGGGLKPSKKIRPISYASRRDAAIFEHYRGKLSEKYEERLRAEGIDECPIAYRKIPSGSGGGKCNIDFAKDAFDFVVKTGKCRTFVIDISSYFPSISHQKIYDIWRDLLGVDLLPEDHFAVYQAITKYSYVDREELYKELGFIGPKVVGGGLGVGYLRRWDEIPTQLCTPAQLRGIIKRRKLAGRPILSTNDSPVGIPQGAPISDVLANMNLLHFDKAISNYVLKKKGFYRRYSDDIIVILPAEESGSRVLGKLRLELSKAGSNLQIKNSKVSVVDFDIGSPSPFRWLQGSGKNGLEYLGFRFDGESIYLRDKTVSNFFRKVATGAKAYVNSTKARFSGMSASDIRGKIKYDYFLQRYGRVEDFETVDDYRQWTFWTYVRRARTIFGEPDPAP